MSGRLEALDISESSREPVSRWLELLAKWNRRMDLTAARSEDELYDLMLADARVLADRVPDRARVVDVGSGAGAPGLALALLRPDLEMSLVEPLGKRVSFLRTVIGTLGRTDVKLHHTRVEALLPSLGAKFDVAISRATLPAPDWIRVGAALATTTWVLLARDAPDLEDGVTIAEDVAYEWPLTRASRRALRIVPSPA